MGFESSYMNGGQYAGNTTFKIEIKSSNSRRRIAAAANAIQLPKRKVEWIVFGA